MTRLVTPHCHEFAAHWNFSYDPENSDRDRRLTPFWAFERAIRESDGSKRITLEHAGKQISAKLYYQESGFETLNHPSENVDTIREFRIAWEWLDDPEKTSPFSGNFHIRPRHPEAVDSDGKQIGASMPDFTGVNVSVKGSNLDFREYLPLFRKIVRKLGISRRYWRDKWLHESSNIRDAERYVRLEGDKSGPIHAVDGPIARIASLLAQDREGYRKHVADDRDVPGKYHTATIGRKRARKLIKLHNLPKEIKHYMVRNPESIDEDHPSAHPKLGASYQASLDPETCYWDQLDRVYRELDETVLNVLQWAGLPISADQIDIDPDPFDQNDESEDIYHRLDDAPGPYVDDAYHRVRFEHAQRRLLDNPLPQIETEQESTVIRALRGGLEESDLDVLETLIADGGQISPGDISDRHGWHLQTVYAAVDRLEGIVEHSYGELGLRSHYVAQRVLEAVRAAEDKAIDALEIAADALDNSDRLARASDSLTEWFDHHGVEIEDRRDGRFRLRFSSTPWDDRDRAAVGLTHLIHQWMSAGFDRDKILQAEIDGLRDLHLHGRSVDSAVH